MSADFSNQFFQQVIPFFIITIFIPFVLLIVYTMIKYYLRAQRKNREALEPSVPAYVGAQSGAMSPATSSSYDPGELPSLDDLVTTNSPDVANVEPPDLDDNLSFSDIEDLLPDLGEDLSEFDEAELPRFEEFVDEVAEPEEAISPPVESSLPDGAHYIPLHTGDTSTATEVITILRDVDDDRLMIMVDGTGYRTLSDVPETKKIFTSIMKELSSVITKPDTREPGTSRQPVPPAVVPKPSAPKPPPQSTSTAPTPPPAPDGTMPGDLPSYRIDDHPINVQKKGRFGRKVDFKPVPDLDIGQAIEAYLQHRLLHTTEFDGRNLHVRTSPTGGITIQVDDKYYEAVSDVEDEDVREFLSMTIQEWQDRQ